MKSYKQLNQLKKLATVIAAKQLTGWNFFIVKVSNQTSYFFEIFLEAKELLQATAKILDQLKKHSVPYVSEWVYVNSTVIFMVEKCVYLDIWNNVLLDRWQTFFQHKTDGEENARRQKTKSQLFSQNQAT